MVTSFAPFPAGAKRHSFSDLRLLAGRRSRNWRQSHCYIEIGMKKPEIAKRLARRAGESQGEAADRLDRVVHQIVSKLRRGEEAPLPGLGKFKVDEDGRVSFVREKESDRG